jgi:hypothetical protein
VWLPTGPDADLRLLTLCVWSKKYVVTLEWLLDAILARLAYRRRPPRAASPEELSLGLPAAVIVGEDARCAVLERLARDFPNRENVKARSQPKPPPMPDLAADADGDLMGAYRKALAEAALAKHARTIRAYRRANI